MQNTRAGRENALRYCTETRRVSRRSCPPFRLPASILPIGDGAVCQLHGTEAGFQTRCLRHFEPEPGSWSAAKRDDFYVKRPLFRRDTSLDISADSSDAAA